MDRKKISEVLAVGSVEIYGDIDEVIDHLSKVRKRYKEDGYLSLELKRVVIYDGINVNISLIGTRLENDKEFAKRKREIAKYKAAKLAKKTKKEKEEQKLYLELKAKFERGGK